MSLQESKPKAKPKQARLNSSRRKNFARDPNSRMNIHSDKSTYKPPYSVVLLDATDAYYYADIMEKMELHLG